MDISQGAYLLTYLDIDNNMEFDPSDYFDDRFIEDSIHKVHKRSVTSIIYRMHS
jgi:hypothetical protein